MHVHPEMSRAQAVAEPQHPSCADIARAGAPVGVGDVAVHRQRVLAAAHHRATAQRAAARRLEPGDELLDEPRIDVREPQRGIVDRESIGHGDAEAPGDRGAIELDVRMVRVVILDLAHPLEIEVQATRPTGGQPRIQPAQVGERCRRAVQPQPHVAAAEGVTAVPADLRGRKRGAHARPVQGIVVEQKAAAHVAHVRPRRCEREREHLQRCDLGNAILERRIGQLQQRQPRTDVAQLHDLLIATWRADHHQTRMARERVADRAVARRRGQLPARLPRRPHDQMSFGHRRVVELDPAPPPGRLRPGRRPARRKDPLIVPQTVRRPVEHDHRTHEIHVRQIDPLPQQRAERISRAHLVGGDERRAGRIPNGKRVHGDARDEIAADLAHRDTAVHHVAHRRHRDPPHTLMSPWCRREDEHGQRRNRHQTKGDSDDAEQYFAHRPQRVHQKASPIEKCITRRLRKVPVPSVCRRVIASGTILRWPLTIVAVTTLSCCVDVGM